MIKNYLKTAWRNLGKSKMHSFINIIGLSIGMAVAMLVGLWIWDELSFNKYYKNYDHIAQVMEQNTINGVIQTSVSIEQPLAPALKKNYGSDFKQVVMSSWTESHILAVGDKKISCTGNFMEPTSPEMFSLKMLKGTITGLDDPSSIVISASVASALFGNSEPIGQIIKLDNAGSLKVTGVYEDLPKNTSLRNITFMAPWEYYVASNDWVKKALDDWGERSFQMFVQLSDHSDMQKVSSKIKDIKLKNIGSEDAKYKPLILLQPMSKWHLFSEFKNGINTGGAIQYVWMFGAIGLFVLLLACINFMNLSTARSEKRAKEVGIRKALGSLRTQLMDQFFCESLLMAIVAFCFALVLVQLALPFFNELSDKNMSVLWTNPFFWLICIVFTLFTGTIAGIYPALYLSSFNPVKVLKGTFRAGRSASFPRKILVVVQFVVSVVLIISTLIVFKQIQYAKNRPVGYNRNGLITVGLYTDDLKKHFAAFETELNASGAIAGIAEASSPMTAIHNTNNGVTWKEKDPNATYDLANIRVTVNYGKTVGWQLLAGRDFSNEMFTDSSAIILNEAAVKYMGLANPLNKIVRFENKDHRVIGVVKDMVMESPYQPARQTIFYLRGSFDNMVLRINPALSTHEALSKIGEIFKKYSPSSPFDYKFVDETYAKKFNNEERVGKLAGFFAMLAIVISCLGLFGLTSFVAEQRKKEIGVRKVLGASVLNIWNLLSKDFATLIVISFAIAIPLSYYYMHNWLQHYDYRTELSWWIFCAASVIAFIIALVTISFQAIKAAVANPVKSLRTE